MGSDDAIGCGVIAVATTALAVVIVGLVFWLGHMLSLPGQLADIEQLRADAAVVDPQQAEDVIGQVTEWNRTIAQNQAYNDQWWAGWAIPDEWNDVELIPVPRP